MKALFIALVSVLGLYSCAKVKHVPAKGCEVRRVQGGTQVKCPGTDAFIPDAKDGANGIDGEDGLSPVIEVIDPCGPTDGHLDEVILRLSDGTLLAYVEDGNRRFFAVIEQGRYRTTDKQRCEFEVTEDLEVID